jgi:hypothetical protein
MRKLLLAVVVVLWPGAASRADSPPPSYIDKGACSFECCVYRTWNTKTDTILYAQSDTNAKVVGVLKAGAIVEALTGEVHSNPVRFVVRKPHAEYKPGGGWEGWSNQPEHFGNKDACG